MKVYCIIGNGFDIEYGLPTRYTDFLRFAKKFLIEPEDEKPGLIVSKVKESLINDLKIDHNIRDILKSSKSSDKDIEKFYELLHNNFWIRYFTDNDLRKHNWIDFEEEIFRIIKELEDRISISKYKLDILDNEFLVDLEDVGEDGILGNIIRILRSDINNREIKIAGESYKSTYRIIKTRILRDIRHFNLAFEKYVSEYVNLIYEEDVSDSIKGFTDTLKNSENLNILNFNYINTIEKLCDAYDVRYNKCSYVHGKADYVKGLKESNIILGFNEYLEEDDLNTSFAEFRKFFQRIYKQTDNSYLDWANEMADLKGGDDIVRIFGHSLGYSDKEIIRPFLLREHTRVEIYYYNRNNLGNKIHNLIKMIGRNELIKRTSDQRIVFVDQNNIKRNI